MAEFFSIVWEWIVIGYNFVVTNWEAITQAVSAVIAIGISTIGWIKTVKKNKNWNVVVSRVSEFMAKIDGQRLTGAQKKELVLEKAEEICKESKVAFDKEKISNLIEDIIVISKKINARPKDAVATK